MHQTPSGKRSKIQLVLRVEGGGVEGTRVNEERAEVRSVCAPPGAAGEWLRGPCVVVGLPVSGRSRPGRLPSGRWGRDGEREVTGWCPASQPAKAASSPREPDLLHSRSLSLLSPSPQPQTPLLPLTSPTPTARPATAATSHAHHYSLGIYLY